MKYSNLVYMTASLTMLATSGCGSQVEQDIELPLGKEIDPVKFKKCLADRLVFDDGQCRLQRAEYAFEQCYNLYANQCWEDSYEMVYKD